MSSAWKATFKSRSHYGLSEYTPILVRFPLNYDGTPKNSTYFCNKTIGVVIDPFTTLTTTAAADLLLASDGVIQDVIKRTVFATEIEVLADFTIIS